MKLSLAVTLFALLSTADAFAPNVMLSRATTSLSMSEIVDTADAVKSAQEASKKFGATSPEARSAWELVEELDASNSHIKSMEKAAKEAEMKKAAAEEPVVQLKPTVHADTAEAVKNAIEAGKIFGKASPEARIAWDIVEELDAANRHHQPSDIHVKKEVAPKKAKEPTRTVLDAVDLPTNSEEAIAQALLMSQIYGRSSSEARSAWELVEEMDAATSHHKKGDIHVQKEPEPVQKPKVRKTVAGVAHKDTSDAIKRALAASKEFGPTSVEARMAWETVEEIDAANAHHKTVVSE